MRKCLICNRKLPMFRHWGLSPSICKKCWISIKKKVCKKDETMNILNSLTTDTPESMRKMPNPPPNIEPDLTEPKFDFITFTLIVILSIGLVYIAML